MKDVTVTFYTAKLAREKGFDFILLPTQSLLQKWIREVYNIVVWLKPYPSKVDGHFINNWSVYIDDFHGRHLITDYIYIHGYEEALEKGLQEALKLIKK